MFDVLRKDQEPSLRMRLKRWCGKGNNAAWLTVCEILWVPIICRATALTETWPGLAAVLTYYVVRWSWRGSWPWKPPKRGWW